MASVIIITIFVLGYLSIAFEHPLRLNKAASALITGVLCWVVHIINSGNGHEATEALMHHLGEIASILFFLLGAMTIVELIDLHQGFAIITKKITTTSKSRLLIIISTLTFFLSALLDNLTTAIVMASLCTKLLAAKEDRLWFCGMIVIAANAGGAWSPLGDVTTTMLWIGGQVSALNIIKQLILPSIAVGLLPMLIVAWKFRGKKLAAPETVMADQGKNEGRIILFAGIGLLLFVPVFKTLTGLPPFMGILLALGLIWVLTTILNKGKEPAQAEKLSVSGALQKVDSPSILFFLGILLAVAALQSFGVLGNFANGLSSMLNNNETGIGAALGLLSALVDNVPLVAAAQGMYDLSVYPRDHTFWEFLALTTGTGGSAIIIGSAAGVAVMGIEKIDFMWYLKKISWLALVGFAAGIGLFLLQQQF